MSKHKKVLKKHNTQTNQTEEIDYLTEDPVIEDQKFVCVSFLKPSSIVEEKRPKNLSVCGFKVRGSYSTYEEAKSRADFLNKCDPLHNIYIAETGKWCPFEDDTEKAKDSEYMNKDLNKLMKSYWTQQSEAKQFHELRKQDMIQKALEDVNKKKENNAKTNFTTSEPSSKLSMSEKKTELNNNKIELDNDKTSIDENIKTLRRLENELDEKIKEMGLEQQNMGMNKIILPSL